jgi:RNase P/RNase MRP subunit POP5
MLVLVFAVPPLQNNFLKEVEMKLCMYFGETEEAVGHKEIIVHPRGVSGVISTEEEVAIPA